MRRRKSTPTSRMLPTKLYRSTNYGFSPPLRQRVLGNPLGLVSGCLQTCAGALRQQPSICSPPAQVVKHNILGSPLAEQSCSKSRSRQRCNRTELILSSDHVWDAKRAQIRACLARSTSKSTRRRTMYGTCFWTRARSAILWHED